MKKLKRLYLTLWAALAVSPWGTVQAEDYAVGPGDLLQVTVYGQEKLSGRFRVATNGGMSYPLLGEVQVAGLAASEVARRLVERLSDKVPSGGMPSVEVVEYAPIFLLGDVDKPGAHQFRPGMIALELLALGGGLRQGPDAASRLLTRIAFEQELADLRIQQFGHRLQRARILAELAGQEFKGMPPGTDGETVPSDIRQKLTADEAALFQTRRSIAASQERALRDQRGSYEQEIATLEESISHHDDELQLLGQVVAMQEGLFTKGLSIQTKVLDLKRELSATKRNALELRMYLARARQRKLEIDQRLLEVRDLLNKENAVTLRDLDVTLARTARKIESVTASLLQAQGEYRLDARNRATEPSYSVTRLEDGNYITIAVDSHIALKPRDILRVDRARTTLGGAVAQDASGTAALR